MKLKNKAEARFIERIEFNNQREIDVKTSQTSNSLIFILLEWRRVKFEFEKIQGSGKKKLFQLNKKSASETRIQKQNNQDYGIKLIIILIVDELRNKFLYAK